MTFWTQLTMDMAEVNAIALKSPPFWLHRPRTWFGQVEAQFHLRDIKADTTKFYHVVGTLNQDKAARVDYIIHRPPATKKYTALMNLLLGKFGLSPQQRASRLLHLDGLGDRSPSALMDEMLALAEDHELCFLFRQIFPEQIPEDIWLHLSEEDFSDPRKAATWADALWQAEQENEAALSQVSKLAPCHQQNPPQGQARRSPVIMVLLPSTLVGLKPASAAALRLPGKRPGQLPLMAAAVGHVNSLLYIQDRSTGRRFLVNTGAELSILLPPQCWKHRLEPPVQPCRLPMALQSKSLALVGHRYRSGKRSSLGGSSWPR
ncbi:uncharacterized protein [Narcine bancroftii]|uniref:uncharacterized protein n=1 Tax=Narcine bancroftii TaxID=1343680 RepID=UPI0038317CF1